MVLKKKEIEEKLKQILCDQLGKKPEEIKPQSRLVEDLGMDSFSAIEIIYEIEDNIRINIDEKEFPKIKTFQDAVEYIIKKLKTTT